MGVGEILQFSAWNIQPFCKKWSGCWLKIHKTGQRGRTIKDIAWDKCCPPHRATTLNRHFGFPPRTLFSLERHWGIFCRMNFGLGWEQCKKSKNGPKKDQERGFNLKPAVLQTLPNNCWWLTKLPFGAVAPQRTKELTGRAWHQPKALLSPKPCAEPPQTESIMVSPPS